MPLPEVVSEEEWRAARIEVLREEKALTRAHDALNKKRRELPMVEVTKTYTFEGPGGTATLLDLFEDRRQLIVFHFMFDPEWDDGCQSCTAGADEIADGLLEHLHTRDTSAAWVSRAPLAKIEDYKHRRGWTFPWYSSFGSDFNYDFHVTIDPSVMPIDYNFRSAAEFEAAGQPLPPLDDGQSMELPGRSHFLRVEDRIFHTNSIYARGLETMGGSYYLLDETALGRQEDWERPEGRSESVRGNEPSFTE
jgi:predicted dithiol-disulfide oxidoreductase (DUF899 family)